MFQVVKRNKRLWIDRDGEAIYTPPNFVKLQSRDPMHVLAARFNAAQRRDIDAIIEFETTNRPKSRLTLL